MMAFYLNGINAIITKWLETECEAPVEEIMAIITTCVIGRPEG